MIRQVADEMVAENIERSYRFETWQLLKLQKRKWIIRFGYAVQEQLYLHILVLYHLHSKQNSRKGWIYMKKENLQRVSQPQLWWQFFLFRQFMQEIRKIGFGTLGWNFKTVGRWRKINTQSAEDEPLYAVGKDVSITMKEYEQVRSFYQLKGEDDGQAAQDADKEIKQYNALYAAAVKNGYSVTDEQVQAYIEDMKLQLESVDNSEDIQDVIDQFDSEDDYWAYEFTVYQKQLPIQNYVSALNDEYNEKAVDSSSEEAQEEWDTYFENLKDKLVKEQNFQNQ